MTNLVAGQLGVIGFNADNTGNPATPAETITFALLAPIDAGTVIYFTDRNWNGTSFPAPGSGDGTYTYINNTGNTIAAGTIITITAAQLSGAGISLNEAGDTLYVYQGTNANTPTTFLQALDFGDGDTIFSGNLTNTGLTAGVSALAIGGDNATYGDRGHNIQLTDLFARINTGENWTQNDNSTHVPLDGNFLSAPDQSVWIAHPGPGGISRLMRDGADTATHQATLFENPTNNLTQFYHPNDIVFDTVNGLFFVADSDTGNRRILQGNIADLMDPGTIPTLKIIYQNNAPETVHGQFNGIAIDTAHGIGVGALYFVNQTNMLRVTYDHDGTTQENQTPVTLATLPANTFANEIALDIANNRAWIMSTASHTAPVQVPQGTPGAIHDPDTNTYYIITTTPNNNEIWQVSGLDRSDTGVGGTSAARLDLNTSLAGGTATGPADGIGGFDLPTNSGLLASIDYHNGLLYFVTQQHSGGTVGVGGLYTYNLGSGAVANHYPEGSGTDYAFEYIDVDPQTGRIYISNAAFSSPGDANGTANNDSSVFIGHVNTPGSLGVFAATGNINGSAPQGLIVNNAPTLTGSGIGALAVTEQSNFPNSTETSKVTLFTSLSASDIDTAGGDELRGAQVRISGNFVRETSSTATGHTAAQDYLTINGLQSGTIAVSGITFSYDAVHGAMTLSGVATVAEYQAALALVQFSTSGDNVTNNGTAATRTVAASVFDGLDYSDEIFATVNVTGINDRPVNGIVTSSFSVAEDSVGGGPVASPINAISGLSIADADADATTETFTVTLSVAHGKLQIRDDVTGGLTAVQITNNGTASVTLTGTQNAINATLAATNGAINGNDPNGVLYTPTLDWHGADTLTMVTNDNGNNGNDPNQTGGVGDEQDQDTITITVTPSVDIANDTINMAEDDGPQTIAMPNNDTFENNDTLDNDDRSITAVTQGAHGAVTIDTKGTLATNDDELVYTQVADYNGQDSFTYTVTSGGATETATVTVNLSAVADIADDAETVLEDNSFDVDVIDNDDFENVSFAITNVSDPLHGSAVVDTKGTGDTTDDTIDYTPDTDYHGSDSFTYTVTSGGVTETATVTMTVTADPDIVDDSVEVDEDSGANNLDLLFNDSFESAGRSITLASDPANGTTTIHNNGTALNTADDYVVYTPDAGYVGSDSFTYTVTSGGATETATVSVTVKAVNDAPENDVGSTAVTSEDVAVNLDGMTVSDTEATGDVTYVLSVANGMLEILTNVLNGIEASDISTEPGTGNDTQSLIITATVDQINATLGTSGGLVYTPNADFNGADTLAVYLNDNGQTGSDPNPVSVTDPLPTPDIGGDTEEDYDERTITVTADADIADDNETVGEDSGANNFTDLFVNDDFEDADRAITAVSDPTNGSAVIDDNGTDLDLTDDFVVYTPDADYSGNDSFTYTVTAGGVTETATVSVTVTADEDAPAGGADNATTDEQNSTDIDVLANDDDVDGPAPAIDEIDGETPVVDTPITLDSGATVTLRSDGKITYDPNGAFDRTPTAGSGALNTPASDSFQYKLVGGGLVTVTLTITGIDTDDLLIGAAGSTLAGGTGNDVYRIGFSDIAITENGGEGEDRIAASVNYTLGAAQSVESIGTTNAAATAAIDLTGNELANSLYGNAGANELGGGGGNDLLVGLAGADVLDGNAGADNMRGGEGSDAYYIDDAGDRVFELLNQGDDTVYSSISYALQAGTHVDSLRTTDDAGTGAINLTGNELGQILIGNAGNNVLNGRGGTDSLFGLGGNDVYGIDNALDQITETAGEGDDRLVSSANYTLGAGVSVETMGTSDEAGTGAIDLTGNEFNNSIYGNAGANVLSGAGGSDSLRGLGGDDRLNGGVGLDNLRGGAGEDEFVFDAALVAGNVDRIIDFAVADDTILIDNAVFTGLNGGGLAAGTFHTGTAATDADHRIIYNSATGALFFDADGSGSGSAQVLFGRIDPGLALTGADFLVI